MLREVASSSALCNMLAQLVTRVTIRANNSFMLECNSTNLRQEDVSHSTPTKFENAALFLRLGLVSTLIRHENRAFQKRSSNRRIGKRRLCVWTEIILKTELFETMTSRQSCDFSARVLSQTQIQNDR